MDSLTVTKGSRRVPEAKPRILAGSAYQPHSKVGQSPMLPPSHAAPLVFKKQGGGEAQKAEVAEEEDEEENDEPIEIST